MKYIYQMSHKEVYFLINMPDVSNNPQTLQLYEGNPENNRHFEIKK